MAYEKHFLLAQVSSREEVSELLSLDRGVDLVIPRGGGSLVRSITEQAQGRVPVLGHTDGICHVFVDQFADIEKAIRIGQPLQYLVHSY